MNEKGLLTKRDLIENIALRTQDLGINRLILDYINLADNPFRNIFSLYLCIKKLDSPMLADISEKINTNSELFKAIKKVLYVSGEWSALADFYLLETFRDTTANLFTVTDICNTYTNFIRKYTQSNRTVTITMSDSLYGVVCEVSTLYIERMV